ncbi:KIR protein [Plasmodium knowlesi strain H]|uniref:KIR protein n=3 Tax=Plasmodium knowlesi TaxID=5850 RepID=A0A5K1U4F0_PLAKH|nr:KIR protein [Plasmodium knowlesi strain H]OTN65533.1 KIR protein [Plasmodium knowlesi]CAA9989763.1 KIR protein [Plasmodium knowlesi strain H]SBO22934.1 KIR protein [Plasmodium knowlesi strain H]SBO22964.1 KIR protein [Plasmodium knowlesi strain H]VVS79237.1 KIR protein [Plasmodium knowlesi strain H]|eukprot:XP_002260486.1 KIR protein [Plasmodium knowlesi strain H]
MVDYEDRLNDPILKQLPSTAAQKELKELKESGSACTYSDVTLFEDIKDALGEEEGEDDDEGYISTLKKIWCYGRKDYGGQSALSQNVRCGLLYYWIGDNIFSSLEDSENFPKVMDVICREVQKLDTDNKCNIVCSHIDKIYFKYEKEIYEYYRDHEAIGTELESAGSGCKDKLNEYVSQANQAYKMVDGQCKLDPSGGCEFCKGTDPKAYCNKFSDVYNKDPPQELMRTKCILAQQLEQRPQARDLQIVIKVPPKNNDGATNDTTPIPAIFGTIATLGAALGSFFIYKYTSLFDGIKNSLFGGSNRNRRGRRSTVRHNQHFDDTFTENDSSTLGDDGSTTVGGGGSSTDVSTIYDDGGRPSGRTRATNNRRPGNIRYYAT